MYWNAAEVLTQYGLRVRVALYKLQRVDVAYHLCGESEASDAAE